VYSPYRDAQFSHLTVGLRDEGRSHRFELKALGSHLVHDLSNGFQRKSIEGFLVRSSGHVSRFRLDPFVGHNVQVLVVHEPIQLVVDPLSAAIQLS